MQLEAARQIDQLPRQHRVVVAELPGPHLLPDAQGRLQCRDVLLLAAQKGPAGLVPPGLGLEVRRERRPARVFFVFFRFFLRWRSECEKSGRRRGGCSRSFREEAVMEKRRKERDRGGRNNTSKGESGQLKKAIECSSSFSLSLSPLFLFLSQEPTTHPPLTSS